MTEVALPPNVTILTQLDVHDDEFDVSNADLMRQLSMAEDRHFWHKARNELIIRRLERLGITPPQHVLELGCGGGCVSSALDHAGYRVMGVDGHLVRVAEAARRAPSSQFLVHDLRLGVESLPNDFQAVGLFDVIEHLDDPVSALQQATTRVPSGGYVVGTVPALMQLWSEIDVLSGHRTRYTESSLRTVLAAVQGTSVVEITPFNRALVLPIWLRRKAPITKNENQTEELKLPSPMVNSLMHKVLRAEYRIAELLPFNPFPGASLWFALKVC